MAGKKLSASEQADDILEDGTELGDESPDEVEEFDEEFDEEASDDAGAIEPAAPSAPVSGVIVPSEFAGMRDEAKSAAMKAYRRALKRGMPYDSALFEGVTAGKEWARQRGVSHRK